MFWNADIIDFCSLSAYVATASPGSSSASEDAVTTYGYLATSGLGIVDADTSFAHSILVYNATAGNKEDVNSPIYPDAAHNFTNCGPVDAGSPSAGVYVEALGAHANLTSSPTIQQQCVMHDVWRSQLLKAMDQAINSSAQRHHTWPVHGRDLVR